MGYNFVSNIMELMDWLNTNNDTFTIPEMLEKLDIKVNNTNKNFCIKFIEYNQLAYNLHLTHSPNWVSRAAVFRGVLFAVKPTAFELGRGIFIPGSRFFPYINHLLGNINLQFHYKEKRLDMVIVPLTFAEVQKYYYLWHKDTILDELQLLTPYNTIRDISTITDDDIFYVPAFDIKKYYKAYHITQEDQIVFKVEDWWMKGVSIYSKSIAKRPPKYEEDWIARFKRALPFSLSMRQTENNSICDVLAYMLYAGNDIFLRSEYYMPLQSYIQDLGILDDVRLGVKDLRWTHDGPIITTKEWFHYVLDFRYLVARSNTFEYFFANIGSPITEDMIKIFIYDFIEQNYLNVEEEPELYKKKCIDAFIDEFFYRDIYKSYHKKIRAVMAQKYKKYLNRYEPFKNKDLMSIAVTMFNLFRRIYASLSYLQELNVTPSDIDSNISIVINQMTMDMEISIRNMGELLDGKKKDKKEYLMNSVRDLAQRFDFIVENTEEFILSKYGKKH